MIERVYHVLSKVIVDELLRVGKIKADWLELTPNFDGQLPTLERGAFKVRSTVPSWILKVMPTGGDVLSFWAAWEWIREGPKIFRPTPEQCAALEQVEVRVPVSEYAQPYRGILIELPKGFEPFENVICAYSSQVLVFLLQSKDRKDDICSTIYVDGRDVEMTIQKFSKDTESLREPAQRALRVAINANLAMVNYGAHARLLYPHEVERDRRLAKEDTERGQRARERLPLHVSLVSFSQDVRLHETEGGGSSSETERGGYQMRPHWRRGYWMMQAHGPGHSLRKRMLRKPVLVRADRFLGDTKDTSTTYH